MTIVGLHHVTATVGEAQADLDFCVGLLGLRLVKQTVNFDNHRVFHFYYGNAHGQPGTLWTTFPYAGQHVRTGTIGASQVVATGFSVPEAALDAWRERFTRAGVAFSERSVFDESRLAVRDPSGLFFEIVGTRGDDRAAWSGQGLPPEVAIRGLHGVTLLVHDIGATRDFIEGVLGCRVRDEIAGCARLDVGAGGPGRQFDVRHDADAIKGVNGIGAVHHVAFAVESDEAQLALQDELQRRGVHVTPVMDRQYFRSIYFREPGGVLFEVATMAPGFSVDEPTEALGTSLKLPAWQESSRAAIEAGLPRIRLR